MTFESMSGRRVSRVRRVTSGYGRPHLKGLDCEHVWSHYEAELGFVGRSFCPPR